MTVYNTQTVLKYYGKPTQTSPGLASCTLSRPTATTFLREALTTMQLRIEIYESEKGTTNKWMLAKAASPGNLSQVEELLFAKDDLVSAPIILALKLSDQAGKKIVGISFADTSTMRLGVAEFDDNDLFSNTEVRIILPRLDIY